jgi:hypothetical protein
MFPQPDTAMMSVPSLTATVPIFPSLNTLQLSLHDSVFVEELWPSILCDPGYLQDREYADANTSQLPELLGTRFVMWQAFSRVNFENL